MKVIYNKLSNFAVVLRHLIAYLLFALLFVGCASRSGEERIVAPWGEVGADSAMTEFDLDAITSAGELIALTLSGPDTYYDWRGEHLGTQYMLCRRFAREIGVALRVEVCRDSAEVERRIADGDGDIGLLSLTGRREWIIAPENDQLRSAVKAWLTPAQLQAARDEERRLLATGPVRRHIYAPMLNRSAGIISRYDALFMANSRRIGWDWRLIAAQCYQESAFDPQARSWAGAQGLMQIMPATADLLGLPRTDLYKPESNIAAAATYLDRLEGRFRDIPSRTDRQNFVLAAYNGGYNHIRDAMALAARDRQPMRWANVAPYVLKLMEPRYYRDPIVQYGYMRGTETVEYVRRIQERYATYKTIRLKR